MLKEKQMLRFNERLKECNNYTTEKEIETEFYKFISQYYENKYTKKGRGVINYTAPYNIDGLLEIRTLDHDYRILVEAKASKNYNNKKTRDEVLSQAIYYCRKLNHYNELLPAVLLLIEKKSLVLIKTNELKELIDLKYNGSSASGAYKTDEELICQLNNISYGYDYYEFNDNTGYNVMFSLIDAYGYESEYKITKNRDFNGDNNMIIFGDFTKQYNNIRYYINKKYKHVDGRWFTYNAVINKWIESDVTAIRRLLLDFIKVNNYLTGKLEITYLMNLLKDYYSIKTIEYIKFNNCLVNVNSGITVNNSDKYFFTKSIPLTFYEKNTNAFNAFSFNELFNGDKQVFIRTNSINYKVIQELALLLNLTINDFNTYDASRIIIFDDSNKLKIPYGGLSIESFIVEDLEEKINLNNLCNMLISCKNDSIADFILSKKYLQEWNENSDPLLSFFNEYIELDKDSFVLMLDFADAYNYVLRERGQAFISMRSLVEDIKNHPFLSDNYGEVIYKSKSRVLKGLKQSQYEDPNDFSKIPRIAPNQASYIQGIKFKKQDDNY